MVKVPNPDKKPKTMHEFAKLANSDAPKSSDNLEKVPLRLHPDVIKAIEEAAHSERKNFSETIRDIVMAGMKVKGIELF